jgi:hypothetical protein
MRTLWTIGVAVGAMAHALGAAAMEPGVYFRENFRNYREIGPTTTDGLGIRIDNDPIWTNTAAANCRMTESGLIFNQYMPAGGAVSASDYDVLFRFSFHGEEQQRFDLRVRHQQQDKVGYLIVRIAGDRVRVESDGLDPVVTAEAKLHSPVTKGQWRQAAVTMSNGTLRVVVDDNRVLKTVVETRVSAGHAVGINFHGYKDAGFSVSDVVFRAPAPLPDYTITRLLPTPLRDDAGFKSGAEQPSVVVPANDMFGATIRIGAGPDPVKMTVTRQDGTTYDVTFTLQPIKGEHTEPLPDGMIQIRGIDDDRGLINYHVRPMLRRYHTSYSFTDTYHDILRDWDLLPKASELPVTVEARRYNDRVDFYLNGRFAGRVSGGVTQLEFALPPGASHREVVSRGHVFDATRYLPLDIAALRRARAFADATASLPPGDATIQGVPMRIASGRHSADVGLAREGQGNWALEVDEYLARSAFDGLLTEVHFAVPSAPYTKAWVLCAVDPDLAKDPILTTRLAAYVENGAGNNTLVDTHVTLPRGEQAAGEGIVKVGTVTLPGIGGKSTTVPLYLVEVPLRSGEIIDLIARRATLNFEFFGKPSINLQQLDNSSKPDPDSTSAVQIFGVTLEQSPVMIELVQSQPGNVFHNKQTPQTDVKIRALAASSGRLTWRIRDVDGQPVRDGAAAYDLNAPGKEQVITIPLDAPDLGWYELLITVQDASDQVLLSHPARFALLGEDRRRAHYESPYGIWWFDGAHDTPSELDYAGPIMFKAGIRQVAWTKQSEADMAAWTLGRDQVNMPFRFEDLKDPEVAKAKAQQAMDEHLRQYPHLREVLIFHESGPGNDIPLELVGMKPTLHPLRAAHEQRYADLFNLAGAFFREKYPQLKLVVGNNSGSQSVMAAIFRHGGNPDYIDSIGVESPAQVFIPEKLQEWGLQGHLIAADTVRLLTGRDVPSNGCYEFTYRSERDMGEHQQAQWYVRDMLIGLANGFNRIGPGILFDTANAYHNGLWGSSGILTRGPVAYPKKSYVAYATLTNVLDQVKLRRQVPTGSTTVYALDFERSDGKTVAALWASRGDAQFVVEFDGETAAQVVDMYGRTRQMQTAEGRITVEAGASPAYVVADRAVRTVTIAGRSFPADQARAERAVVVAELVSVGDVAVDPDDSIDTPKVAPLQLPIREAGAFHVRQVEDDAMGPSIEVVLDTSAKPDLSKYITPYTTIRLKQPAPVEGEPAALGVWVKGNSNWGRIMFEFQDAEGEVWRSLGTGGWGCDILDWPGQISVNFDGWNFISLPLRETTLYNDHSPGPVLEQWVSSGGNKRIDFPITVTALIVEMNHTTVDLVDFKPVNPAIRLRNISSIADDATP